MTTSASAANARETARRSDGKFGTQEHGEPKAVSLNSQDPEGAGHGESINVSAYCARCGREDISANDLCRGRGDTELFIDHGEDYPLQDENGWDQARFEGICIIGCCGHNHA